MELLTFSEAVVTETEPESEHRVCVVQSLSLSLSTDCVWLKA